MCRTKEHESILAFSLPRGAVMALCLLVLLCAFALDAAAQQDTGSATTTEKEEGSRDTTSPFVQSIPPGYSVEGPLTVFSASPDAIKFYVGSEKKPLVLNLKGTTCTVKDAQNNPLSLAALVRGVTVFVYRSPDKKTVLVLVVPKRKEKDDV